MALVVAQHPGHRLGQAVAGSSAASRHPSESRTREPSSPGSQRGEPPAALAALDQPAVVAAGQRRRDLGQAEPGGARDRVGRRRRARPGTASSTCRCRGVEPVARPLRRRAARRAGARPAAPTSSRTSSPRGHQRRRAGADQLVDALRRRAGDRARARPSAAGCSRAAQLAVLSAPLRTAASTTTVPRRQGGDQPVAGQEPQPGRARSPGGASETTARARGEVVEQLACAPRVGAVGAAGEHRDRRPAAGERAAVGGDWSMPNAAPETTAPARRGHGRRRCRRRRRSP